MKQKIYLQSDIKQMQREAQQKIYNELLNLSLMTKITNVILLKVIKKYNYKDKVKNDKLNS